MTELLWFSAGAYMVIWIILFVFLWLTIAKIQRDFGFSCGTSLITWAVFLIAGTWPVGVVIFLVDYAYYVRSKRKESQDAEE